MAIGVTARALFSGVRARPRALAGVKSVRRDLPLGCHGQADFLVDRFSSQITGSPSITRFETSRTCSAKLSR